MRNEQTTQNDWLRRIDGLHHNKVALITGGSGGIGAQVGRVLALSGAKVMLAARRVAELETVQRSIIGELEQTGYTDAAERVKIQPDCDVGDPTQVRLLAERTLAEFGQVDYLINNAAITGAEEMVMDLPLDKWRQTLQANLVSNYALIRQLAPQMKTHGSGYVINVSSYFGGEKYVAIAYPNRADYAVSKAGQRALAESMARFLGPEIQINTVAPGPVDGERLRGSQSRPSMFTRRARVILENKRLNEVYTTLIESYRATGLEIAEILPALLANDVQAIKDDARQPEGLRRLANTIWEQSDPAGTGRCYFLNESLALKLVRRLEKGGYLPREILPDLNQLDLHDRHLLGSLPPEPFFSPAEFEREACRIQERNLGMLYLKRMPTDLDLALSMAYHLADHYVTGETFYSSGGLKMERAVTEGELFGKASPERLKQFCGTTVFLIGEHLRQHLARLAQTFLEEYEVGRLVILTESDETAQHLLGQLPADERLQAFATHGNLEEGIDRAQRRYGKPAAIVSTPFRALPSCRLVGSAEGDWSKVLSEEDFTELIEQQITHHFRVAQKAAFIDGGRLVLVTPATGRGSTDEEFALANFIKTTLHAFTATLGAESERTIHYSAVNQVDLTRRARDEEPRNAAEEEEELIRFVTAVLLTSATLPSPQESRYRSRIYRGNAITV